MTKILIIDDEPQIRRFLGISLKANGHETLEAENAVSGIAAFRAQRPDLVILDLGLPDMDGQEVISEILDIRIVPIIVLSVRPSETDKVESLDRGAVDYIVKPFGIGELMARVRVALRHGADLTKTESLQVGNIVLDFSRRIVTKGGQEVHLSRKEYDLLHFLATNADHVLTHAEILKAVWGKAHVQDTAYLRVYINQLRQKLEDTPATPTLLVTETGVGYRMKVCFDG